MADEDLLREGMGRILRVGEVGEWKMIHIAKRIQSIGPYFFSEREMTRAFSS